MSFTRKGIETTLKANGVTENLAEIVNAIIEQHTEVTDALKEQINDLKGVQKQLDDVTKERDNLQAKVDSDKSAERITELENELNSYKDKEILESKTKAYTELLKGENIDEKWVSRILKITDFSQLEIGKDGKIKGEDEIKANIQNEYADYIVSTQQKGHTPPNPKTDTQEKDEFLEGFDAD